MNKSSYQTPMTRTIPVVFEGDILASNYDPDNLTEIFDIEEENVL